MALLNAIRRPALSYALETEVTEEDSLPAIIVFTDNWRHVMVYFHPSTWLVSIKLFNQTLMQALLSKYLVIWLTSIKVTAAPNNHGIEQPIPPQVKRNTLWGEHHAHEYHCSA